MNFIADLHIHSPYSRATSKNSHLHGLAAWAAIKGIEVVGTGDFTHPVWLSHLQENLVEAEPGFFRLQDTRPEIYSDVVPAGLLPDITGIRFVLTTEISSIYKRGGRVRKVHNILFAPDFASVRRINATLSAIGNLESDGRPILGLDSRDLLEIVLEKAPGGFLVPAHIWTPWFSLFGSKSGFDSIEECFGDLSQYVFALETGLSSDPDMNRKISALDRFALISNSDCHSPAKLGREANIFTTGFDFFAMRAALQNPADSEGRQHFAATIEFYPEEGKYHCDGHRKCGICLEPSETREQNGICPRCGQPVTVGVLNRVMELADREKPLYPAGSPRVHSLVPLPEILGELLRVGPASKKVQLSYVKLIREFGSEFNVLLHADPDEIGHAVSPLFAEAVRRVRDGQVLRQPGYDGRFGVVRVFSDEERERLGGQLALFASPGKVKTKARRTSRGKAGNKPVQISRSRVGEKDKTLNPEQRQVVESKAHHIIVQAGPGTGKTYTLVQRLLRIASDGNNPCTVITFTNKAAGELRHRIQAQISEPVAHIHVSTLHGYCLQWLRRRMPGIKVAGPEMRRWFLSSLYCDRDKSARVEIDQAITGFLQQGPDLTKPFPAELQAYFDLLEQEGFIDIDAVVPALATLLGKREAFAGSVRQGTGRLFIDEFQDLNRSQYEIVRLLAETSSVFAIGDPDQAIYGFRGSSPQWFYRFIEELRPELYSLFRNYRSGGKIVAAAGQLIQQNTHPGPFKTAESAVTNEGSIFVHAAHSPRAEANFIVQQIEQLIGGSSHREVDRLQQMPVDGEITLQDIAVVYRTSRQADILASTLYEHGFPIQVVDVRPYYLKDPVRTLYTWILLAAGKADSADLFHILEKEPGGGKQYLRELEPFLPKIADSIFEEINENKENLSEKLKDMIREFAAVRDQLRQIAAEENITGVLQFLAERFSLDREDPDMIRFERLGANFGSSLTGFADHLLLHRDSIVYDDRAEAVTLMTLHASKGLEFKVVFVAGLEEGMLPLSYPATADPQEENEHIEEERRLFYVGITRGGDIVYLTRSIKRKVGREVCEQIPSRFLQELPAEHLIHLTGRKNKIARSRKGKQLNLFEMP